jgi:hypothetical protein
MNRLCCELSGWLHTGKGDVQTRANLRKSSRKLEGLMWTRIASVIGAAIFAAVALSASLVAQAGSAPASAPLKSSVQVPAAGENAALDGTVSVRSSLNLAPDGAMTLSYVCDASGSASGETSGARFAISGSDTGDVQVTQALPADVGLSCSMTLVAPNAAQQFRITLQATLDVDGSVRSIVLRTIAAL